MGLAVEFDGGAITDALICAKVLADTGVHYQGGWITIAVATVKIFIDVLIGIWSFILALVWCTFSEYKPDERMKFSAVLDRFPRFMLG